MTKLQLQALDVHAQANKSDPFARARLVTHLRNGIENDAQAVIVAGAGEILRREQIVDRDYRAWRRKFRHLLG